MHLFHRQGAVAERRGYNPLTDLRTYIALAALAAVGGLYAAVTIGRPATVNYPSGNPPAATAAAPTAAPTAQAPTAKPVVPSAPRYFIESPDGLARIDFPGLTEADARPFIDFAYQKAKTENAKFYGVVTGSYTYVDGRLVKQEGKKLLRQVERGNVIVELECPPCDYEALNALTTRVAGDYKFILDAMQPSKSLGLYVTVSPDGQRFNVTYFLDRINLTNSRTSMTAFDNASGHLDPSSNQMLYKGTLAIDNALGYSGEGFLFEFWAHRNTERVKQDKGLVLMGLSYQGRPWITLDEAKTWTDKTNFSYSSTVRDSFNQVKLGLDVYTALMTEGFNDSMFRQLAQGTEGKRVSWEQFKAEADAVVGGRHLATLDYIDEGIRLWRVSQKQSFNTTNSVENKTVKERWKQQRGTFEGRMLARAKSYRR